MNTHTLDRKAEARTYSQVVAENIRTELTAAGYDLHGLAGILRTSTGRARRLWHGRTAWTLREMALATEAAGIDMVELFPSRPELTAAA